MALAHGRFELPGAGTGASRAAPFAAVLALALAAGPDALAAERPLGLRALSANVPEELPLVPVVTDRPSGFGLASSFMWRTQLMLDVNMPNTWLAMYGATYVFPRRSTSVVIEAFGGIGFSYTSLEAGRRDLSASAFGLQLGATAAFLDANGLGVYLRPLIDIWTLDGDLALGGADSYALSELAAEAGIAIYGSDLLWSLNLLHVGYSPDAGASGPFYPGLGARALF